MNTTALSLNVDNNTNIAALAQRDMETRQKEQDFLAAIDIAAHDRLTKLEEIVKDNSENHRKIINEIKPLEAEVLSLSKEYADKVDDFEYVAIASSLESAGFGTHEVSIKHKSTNCKKRIVEYTVSIKKAHYHVYAVIDVPFDTIEGLSVIMDQIDTLSARASKIASVISSAQEMIIRIPKFKNSLKVEFNRSRLETNEDGQDMLKLVSERINEGMGTLQIESD